MTSFWGKGVVDSLGIKEENGKKFIMHRVDQGETLFAISRRYNVDVEVLKDTNPQSEDELVVGEVILIPLAEAKGEGKSGKYRYHTVEKEETLFSISQEYNASVEQIKEWNDLESNNIEVGQELKVGKKKGNSKDAKPEQEKGDTSGPSKGDPKGEKVKVDQKEGRKKGHDKAKKKAHKKGKKGEADKESAGKQSDKADKGEAEKKEKMSEYEERYVKKEKEIEGEKEGWVTKKQEGKATWINDRNMSTRKSLALHRSAPPGTVIRVENPQNDKVVYVKTVGLLNEDNDEKTLITISRSAAEKLGVDEDFFRAKLQYSVKKESN